MSGNDLVTKEDLAQAMEEFKKMFSDAIKNATATKQWLRGAEVLEMLGISASNLQNMRINGTIPYTKLGGSHFYNYQDIIKTLEKNKKNTI